MKVTEIFTLGYGGRDDDHRNRDWHHDGYGRDWDRHYWRREYRYWDRGSNCWRYR